MTHAQNWQEAHGLMSGSGMTLDRAEEVTRDKLFAATGHIRNESTAGLVFGIGLVATDYLFAALHWLAA